MPERADIALAQSWARFYRDAGFNPLPKLPTANRPWLKRVTKLRDDGIGEGILENWWADGIQLATGGIWRLLVIDLDGTEAVEVWRDWTLHRRMPRTWEVLSGSGTGRHLYYLLPSEAEVRKMVLWYGGKHKAIEALGTGSLAVAPPSFHPATGLRYGFAPGCSPHDLPRPADVPAWLLYLCLQKPPEPEPAPLPRRSAPRGTRRKGKGHDWEDVKRSIHDPVSLAKSWGVRVASSAPNPADWLSCHSIYRPDKNPSASLSSRDGSYWEPFLGRKPHSLFQLAVELGIYRSFSEAVNALGDLYL